MLIVDSVIFHAMFAFAMLFAATLFVLGVALMRSRTVGGLTFCRLGRLGFSFYISR